MRPTNLLRTRRHNLLEIVLNTRTLGSASLSLVFLVGAFAAATCAAAQPVEKDVPYVPTPDAVVDKMLEMAEVKPDDYVIDLGSGDGRILVRAAKKYGIRGFGVDIDPERIKESKENAQAAGVADKVEFRQANLFETDFSKATVLTMYLLPQVNLDLRPKILSTLRPGTRVVSHDFNMGEWQPDDRATLQKVKPWGGDSNVYLWIVPARVEGVWTVQQKQANGPERRFTLNLKQKFQEVEGEATMDGRSVPVRDGRLNGQTIHFSLDDGSGEQRWSGRVSGNKIEATGAGTWSATKAAQ